MVEALRLRSRCTTRLVTLRWRRTETVLRGLDQTFCTTPRASFDHGGQLVDQVGVQVASMHLSRGREGYAAKPCRRRLLSLSDDSLRRRPRRPSTTPPALDTNTLGHPGPSVRPPRHGPTTQRQPPKRSSSHQSAPFVIAGVRTKTVKKHSRLIVEKYYSRLTLDFHTNKRIVDEVAVVPSKRMRNKVTAHHLPLPRAALPRRPFLMACAAPAAAAPASTPRGNPTNPTARVAGVAGPLTPPFPPRTRRLPASPPT